MAIIGMLFSRMSLALAGTAMVSVLALGGVHILESRGALKERANFMKKLARENAADAKALAKAHKRLQGDYAKAQEASDAAVKRAAQLKEQVAAAPKDGGKDICPVDCLLPSYLRQP